MRKITLPLIAAAALAMTAQAKADGYYQSFVEYPPSPGQYGCHWVVFGDQWYGWIVPANGTAFPQGDDLAGSFKTAKANGSWVGIWGGGAVGGACGNVSSISWVEFD